MNLQELLAEHAKEQKKIDQEWLENARRIHDISRKHFFRTQKPPIHTFVCQPPYPRRLPMELGDAAGFEYKCAVCGTTESYIASNEGCMNWFKRVIVGNHI